MTKSKATRIHLRRTEPAAAADLNGIFINRGPHALSNLYSDPTKFAPTQSAERFSRQRRAVTPTHASDNGDG